MVFNIAENQRMAMRHETDTGLLVTSLKNQHTRGRFCFHYVSKTETFVAMTIICELLICPEIERVYVLSTGARRVTTDGSVYYSTDVWKNPEAILVHSHILRYFGKNWKVVRLFKERQFRKYWKRHVVGGNVSHEAKQAVFNNVYKELPQIPKSMNQIQFMLHMSAFYDQMLVIPFTGPTPVPV